MGFFNKTRIPTELQNNEALFKYLEVGPAEIKLLSSWPAKGYLPKIVSKRKGGTRTLHIPNKRQKFLQRKLLKLFEKIYTPRYAVHGFVKRRGVVSNASQHVGKKYILNLDIKSFFDTITRNRVFGLFRGIGIPNDVSTTLVNLCTFAGSLPQGAPTSPILSNMICLRLDKQLTNYAKENRLRYTRYADDITLSAHSFPGCLFRNIKPNAGRIAEEELNEALIEVFNANSLEINHDKTWFMTAKSQKDVTGLNVNEFVNVRRTYIRNIRSSLHKVKTLGEETANTQFNLHMKKSLSLSENLRGRIEYVGQIKSRNHPVFRKLAAEYNLLFPNEQKIQIKPSFEEIAKRAIWIIMCDYEKNGKLIYSQGTAVFVKDIGLVTSDHVFWEASDITKFEIFLPHEPTERFPGKTILKRCNTRDISIVDFDVPNEKYESLSYSTSPTAREDITAIGYPGFEPGDSINERDMKITSLLTRSAVRKLEMGGLVDVGMSGGPVINSNYQVYGIITHGGPQETRQFATLFAEVLDLASG